MENNPVKFETRKTYNTLKWEDYAQTPILHLLNKEENYNTIIKNFLLLEQDVAFLLKSYYRWSKETFVYLTSGFRSKSYNLSVGGSKDSLHTVGLALDICFNFNNNFISFLRSDFGHNFLENTNLYYYIGYNKSGVKFFHFQRQKTTWSNTKTHQFYTKQYPRKYII